MTIPKYSSTKMAEAQAHDYVKNNHALKPQEFSVDGKIYKVINNQVIRMNPYSGMAKCREAVQKIAYMRLPTHSFSNDLTKTLRVAQQNNSSKLAAVLSPIVDSTTRIPLSRVTNEKTTEEVHHQTNMITTESGELEQVKTQPIPKLPRVMSDLESLDITQKISLTHKAILAKSTTSAYTSGYYNRASNNAQAALLEKVTTITGDYHVHSNDSAQVRSELKSISNQANSFMDKYFSADLKEQLINGHGRITDPSGLVMNVLYEKQIATDKPKINIVFSGTFTGEDLSNQLKANFNLVVRGKVSEPLKKADELVGIIKQQVGDNADLSLSGFSLGGAIASYAGLANDIETTTLSTVPLSDNVLKKLNERTKGKLEQRLGNLTNLYVSKDEVTSKLSKNIGTSYKVTSDEYDPNDYKESFNIAGVHNNADVIWIRNTFLQNDINIYTSKAFDEYIEEDLYDKYFSDESKKLTTLDLKQLRYELDNKIDDFLLNDKSKSVLSSSLQDYRYNFLENINSKESIDKLNIIEKELNSILGNKSTLSLMLTSNNVKNLYNAVVEYKSNLNKNYPSTATPISDIPIKKSDALFKLIESSTINKNSPSNIISNTISKASINSNILMGGDEIWPATYQVMAKAEKRIDLQTYIYHEDSEAAKWVHKAIDEIQQRQFDKLNDGQKVEPVEINFYLDHHQLESYIGMKDSFSKNPISNYGIGYTAFLDPRLVKVKTFAHQPLGRGSLHSKSTVVDGKTAVITSANLKYTHSQITTDGEARQDIGIIMTGDVVSQFQQEINTIAKSTEKNLIGTNETEIMEFNEENARFFKLREKYYPSTLKNEPTSDVWHRYDPSLDKKRVEKMFGMIQSADSVLSDVLVLSKPPKDTLSSKLVKSQQRDGILSALNNAEHSIKILGANLNGDEVLEAVLGAISRGVKVEVLLPNSMLDELSALDGSSNHQSYDYLQRKVIELNMQDKLDLRWQGTPDGRLARDGTGGKTHAKYINVDGISIIGSMNLDIQSWKYSGELSMVIKDRKLNEHLDKTIFQEEFVNSLPYRS